MPNLPSYSECCGCAACIDACPKGALSLKEDANGVFKPYIDSNLCVECKLCEKKCHILNQQQVQRANAKEIIPLAGWSKNKDLILQSASGGIFAQLTWDFLTEPNSYVYGAALEDNEVRHIEICDRSEIYKLQGSKYQQSNLTGIFKLVKARLSEGKRVLFSGLPCHIAALNVYLGRVINRDNLYTVEIICHGLPTNQLLRTALRINKASRILSYRHKKFGWGPQGNRVTYSLQNGGNLTFKRHDDDFLFRSYLTFNFSRLNCYECKYAKIERVADITLGDFWGVENSEKAAQLYHRQGTSIILCNSSKGLNLVTTSEDIHCGKVDWEDFLYVNQNLYMPCSHYRFKGIKNVRIIKHLPIFIQKGIFQNGFKNRFMSFLYYRTLQLFIGHHNSQIKEEKQKSIYQQTLKKVRQVNEN